MGKQEVKILTETSVKLPPKNLQKTRYETKTTLIDVLNEMVRIDAVFGAPQARTKELTKVAAAEWLGALGRYPRSIVHDAVTKVLLGKFPPRLGDVVELCREPTDELRAAVVGNTERWETPPDVVISEEERARVLAGFAKWRTLHAETVGADRFDEWAPASQDGASEALKNSRLVRKVPIP